MFAFHGTRREEAIAAIAKDGLKVGGKEVPMAVGAIHGTGIYFCEDPSVSFGYCGDTNKMFLCEILLGKVHEGSGKLAGYDSCHVGNVRVIFTSEQVIPRYLIHFQ